MTRKDYVLIANALHAHKDIHAQKSRDCVHAIAMDLANVLTTDNPNFDRERFLAACER